MHLRITYNGPALTSLQRDPHDLIPALMAVGRLYEVAGYTLIGDVFITARIVGSFHTGSFGLDLRLAGRGYHWYTRQAAKALRAIADGVYDLLRLRQAIADREALHVEHRGAAGVVVFPPGGEPDVVLAPAWRDADLWPEARDHVWAAIHEKQRRHILEFTKRGQSDIL